MEERITNTVAIYANVILACVLEEKTISYLFIALAVFHLIKQIYLEYSGNN